MKYQCLLWDVDGTLLDFEYSQKFALTKCMHEIGITADEQMTTRYAQINDGYWKRLELGEITKEQLLTGRFITLFEEYGITHADVEEFELHYQEYVGSVYQYLDDSLTICKKLQEKYRQFVVTNGVASTQINKLKLSGFDKIMEMIFISEQIGVPKPQKAFFEACFEKIGNISPAEILIIGDSLSSDIKGGQMAGIDTCFYQPRGTVKHTKESDIKPNYVIDNLHQLFGILEENAAELI